MTSHTSSPPSPEADIEPELGALLGVFSLHSYLETLMDDDDFCNGVPHLERKIIVRLDRPKRLGTLAREMNVLPSTMTTAADHLENRGFVVRERDPNDRRAWLLKLTADGADLRASAVMMARTLLCDTLQLTEDELREFAKISLKIHSNIRHLTTC